MTATEKGWCCGFPPQPPHYVDHLVRSSIPDVAFCRPCWARWIRTDRNPEGTTP